MINIRLKQMLIVENMVMKRTAKSGNRHSPFHWRFTKSSPCTCSFTRLSFCDQYKVGLYLAFVIMCPEFAAYGVCHQDPDRVPDPWPSQRPARQNAAREIPDPGNDVRGRAGEAAEGEKWEKEEGQEPSQGVALKWSRQVWKQFGQQSDSCGVWFFMLHQILCPVKRP